MKKAALTIVIIVLSLHTFAQFSGPYRIAYNQVKKSYLISNANKGEILEMDSNYRLSSVIPGLKNPRDLIVGKIGSNNGLLVIDDNKIHVYDASGYNKLIAFNVTGATEVHDIEVDINNPQFFYLSDVGGNKIIKGRVGSPPFYTPSYTTLVSSGLNRPKGMLFNEDKDLLVVTDEKNGKVVKVDTSTGKLTTMLSTSQDSLNHIVQDNEGNYYITNWDDSYLYSCDRSFKNLTKRTSLNKPAGMIVNVETDLLIILCSKCNKMEFEKLHYFEPTGSITACTNDSVTVSLDAFAKGFGTFNSSNNFEVEISDSTGDFSKGKTIGRLASKTNPTSIRTMVPASVVNGKTMYRLKSTSPEFYSGSKSITQILGPDLSGVQSQVSICKGSSVSIGTTPSTHATYDWTPGVGLSDSTVSNPSTTLSDTGIYAYKLIAIDTVTGCLSEVETEVRIEPDIKLINLDRTVEICYGDSLLIGESTNYEVRWSPTEGILDTTKSLTWFMDTMSRSYRIDLSDTSTGCSGFDSVLVTVNPLPQFSVQVDDSLCVGDVQRFEAIGDTSWMYTWSFKDTAVQSFDWIMDSAGDYSSEVRVADENGCSSTDEVTWRVDHYPIPPKWELGLKHPGSLRIFARLGSLSPNGTAKLFGYSYSLDTSFFLTIIDSTIMEIEVDTWFVQNGDFDQVFMVTENHSDCWVVSDTFMLFFENVANIAYMPTVFVYPNPANTVLHVKSESPITQIVVMDLFGREVHKQTGSLLAEVSMDISALRTGAYILQAFTSDKGVVSKRFVVE